MQNKIIRQENKLNSKLLLLLTNRQRVSFSSTQKRDWPGRLNPNIAVTIRILSSRTNNTYQPKANTVCKNKSHSKYKSFIPSIRLAQGKQLILKPYTNSLQFRQNYLKKTLNRQCKSQQTFRYKKDINNVEQNQNVLLQTIFKNLKISKQTNDLLQFKLNHNQHLHEQNIKHFKQQRKYKKQHEQNQSRRKQSLNKIIQRSQTKNIIQRSSAKKIIQRQQTKKIIQRSQSKKIIQQQQTKKYKVSFDAFGYIDKVIDNPKLWTKFVYKQQ